MRKNCKCGGRLAAADNRLCKHTGEVYNVFECQSCGRTIERHARRGSLWYKLQPTDALVLGVVQALKRAR